MEKWSKILLKFFENNPLKENGEKSDMNQSVTEKNFARTSIGLVLACEIQKVSDY